MIYEFGSPNFSAVACRGFYQEEGGGGWAKISTSPLNQNRGKCVSDNKRGVFSVRASTHIFKNILLNRGKGVFFLF